MGCVISYPLCLARKEHRISIIFLSIYPRQQHSFAQGTRDSRPREIFWGFSALWFLKYLGQFLSALAISGHSERFSPGPNGSEVGRPEGLWLTLGPPTLERILPGENLSEWPEIARALRNWPKYFKNHRAENPRKNSRGLLVGGLY